MSRNREGVSILAYHESSVRLFQDLNVEHGPKKIEKRITLVWPNRVY